jgi:alcohol dehydrogenase class IV
MLRDISAVPTTAGAGPEVGRAQGMLLLTRVTFLPA